MWFVLLCRIYICTYVRVQPITFHLHMIFQIYESSHDIRNHFTKANYYLAAIPIDLVTGVSGCYHISLHDLFSCGVQRTGRCIYIYLISCSTIAYIYGSWIQSVGGFSSYDSHRLNLLTVRYKTGLGQNWNGWLSAHAYYRRRSRP